MMRMCKRFFALLLCLCLLPVSVLGEGFGTAFRLSFDMNAAAYPEDVREVLSGIADLLNAVTLEGTLETENGYFETNFDLLVNGAERTRTPVRVYGDKQNWIFSSSLLGKQKVFLYMDAMLEFAMKGYAHMEIPAQRFFTLLTPYVHTHGVSEITAAMAPILFAQPGSRQIPASALVEMAESVAAAAEGRPFRYWAAALGRETGYEYDLRDAMETFPEWVESFVAPDGITVTITDSGETWTTGEYTLFEHTYSLDDAQSISLSLPPLPNGYVITADAAFQHSNHLLHGSIDLMITDAWESVLLDIHADGTLPTSLPVTRAFSLTWDAEGPAVGGDGVHLYFEGEGTGDEITIRQITPDRAQTMLTLTFSDLKEMTPSVTPYSVDDLGQSIASLTSDTLESLMRTIISPMIKGLLPILAEVPATACQSILDLLEDSGVFGLVTDGLLGEGESSEEDWSEEDWSDEEWSEEDWEDWDEEEEIW